MTPTDIWPLLRPIIGPLGPRRRAEAVAHVLQAIRGRADVGAVEIARLAEELRQRFGDGAGTCH